MKMLFSGIVQISSRKVINIDIFNPYLSDEDKALTPNLKSFIPDARGQAIDPDWQQKESDVMINYQFSEFEFSWWGIQDKVEIIIERALARVSAIYHRQMYFWMDEWHGMTLADIEAFENSTRDQLVEKRQQAEFTGLTF